MSLTTKSVLPQAAQSNDDLFAAACGLARDTAVLAVHVATSQSLTCDELLQYRRRANDRNLGFVAIKARGGLGFRLFRRTPEHRKVTTADV